MNKFKKIKNVRIKRSDYEYIIKTMQHQGIKGNELFLYLLGEIDDYVGIIHEVYIPKQYCFKGEYGVGVLIDSDSIEHMNKYVYSKKLINIVQVHSHPSEAYHSLSDDMNSIMIIEGQYSIVFPYFCNATKDSFYGVKIYRLQKNGKWKKVFSKKPNRFLDVIDGE